MTIRLTAIALGLTGLFGLVGCGGMYEEAAYPEAPPPAPRQASAVDPQPETAPVPPPESQELVVGGDNDDDTLYRETDPSALTEFRTTLAPYGTWVDDETYGTVWVPSTAAVGADFTPYVTAGHWNYDDGYVWASDYEWGWAPFHYGRWVYVTNRGWSWIPGRTYRGAWVSWRTGPAGFGYVGWGPMAPSWYWRNGYAYGFNGGYRTPYYFCENRYVFHPQVSNRVVRGPMAADIGKRTEAYVPAEPRVDQGRVAAAPRLGEIGSGGPSPTGLTTPASTGLRRGAAGPDPSALGLETSKLPRTSAADKGVARAYDFGSPKSAVALGARAPSAAPRPMGALVGAPSTALQGPARVGGIGPAAPDHPQALRPHDTAIAPSAPTRLPPLRAERSERSERAYAPPASTTPYVPRMSELHSTPPMVEHHRAPQVAESHSVPSAGSSFRSSPSTGSAFRSGSTSSPSFSSRSSASPSSLGSPSSPSSFRSGSVSRPSASPSGGGASSPSSAPRSGSASRIRR